MCMSHRCSNMHKLDLDPRIILSAAVNFSIVARRSGMVRVVQKSYVM